MRMLRGIGLLFGLIGTALAVAAYWAYSHTQGFIDQALSAQGTVIELSRSSSGSSTSGGSSTYRPVVVFQDHNGQRVEFIASVGSNPPSHRKGDRVEVLYRRADPQDAAIDSFLHLWFTASLLGGLGMLFFTIGASLSILPLLKRRSAERLRTSGKPIRTQLTQVSQNTRYRAGGRHPYQLVTQWQDPMTGRIRVFTSDNIWFDPSDYLPTDGITVFIQPGKPERYHVDLSFLPKLAG